MDGMRAVTLVNGAVIMLPPGMTLTDVAAVDELIRERQLVASARPDEPLPANVRPIRQRDR